MDFDARDPEEAAERIARIRAKRGTPERDALVKQLTEEKTRTPKLNLSEGQKSPHNSKDMFGHAWPFWFRMRDAGYAYICRCAAEGRPTTYGELWEDIQKAIGQDTGNPWRQMPALLATICRDTHENIGLLATCLVIYQDGDESPGEGFFRMACQLGYLADEHFPPVGIKWTGMTAAQSTFWHEQVSGMYKTFSASLPTPSSNQEASTNS